MFNLYEILRSAQGGQAVENLASQFNVPTEEADAAVKAIVPELSDGFLKQASEPVALGSFFGSLGSGHYREAFADPVAAQTSAQRSGDFLTQVLGSSSAQEEIVQRAASATGIAQDTLSKMLPVIVSTILGGLTKSLENQGFGGILGQLSNAANQGSLGPILGQILGGKPPAESPSQPAQTPGPLAGAGGLGGILGAILGSLKGLAGASRNGGPATSGAAAQQTQSFDAATIQAGLEALKKILQPGTPPASQPETPTTQAPGAQTPGGQQSDISAELDKIIGRNPGL
jgi:hypothetical protein